MQDVLNKLTPEWEDETEAELHVSWQGRTNEPTDVAWAWAQSGVGQNKRSCNERTNL